MKASPPHLQAAAHIQGVQSDDLFDAVPMSLWLEDYSDLYRLFEQWRAEGVVDFERWLAEDHGRVKQCASSIRIQRVNRQALSLYGADSADELMSRLGEVMRDDTLAGLASEMLQLWNSGGAFRSTTVNYTLDGRRLDIVLRGVVLPDKSQPWDQVLVVVDDVTELQQSRCTALANERMAREFFEQAPVSLWVEDFSRIKELMDDVRAQGIVDFRTFLDVHPEFVERCMSEIRVRDVNGYTLKMYKAKSQDELLRNLGIVFDDEMAASFSEQLVDLWEGKLFQQREVRNRTLTGDLLYIHLQLSVFAGHEDDWGLVLVALTDITARKKAEAYLEYLGKHDVLTQLKNRSFYIDELDRLRRKHVGPVSFIALDMDNLKTVNDTDGHAAGDTMLRRLGEVLNKAIDRPGSASRIGGDEFMVVLPGVNQEGAEAVLADIRRLIELNNQFYGGVSLSVSVGVATAHDREEYERALRDADLAMYRDKQERNVYRRADKAQ